MSLGIACKYKPIFERAQRLDTGIIDLFVTPVLNYEENRRHTHIDKVPHTEKIQYKKHLHAIIRYG